MTFIGEKIIVAAIFKNGVVVPKKFIWRERELIVNKVSLGYAKNIGESLTKFFNVNILGSTSSYELSFNTKNMVWRLEKIEDDYAC